MAFSNRSRAHTNQLTKDEIACARQERLKETQMYSIIRETLDISLFYITSLYSNRDANLFLQIQHLQKYFFNSRPIHSNYQMFVVFNEKIFVLDFND